MYMKESFVNVLSTHITLFLHVLNKSRIALALRIGMLFQKSIVSIVAHLFRAFSFLVEKCSIVLVRRRVWLSVSEKPSPVILFRHVDHETSPEDSRILPNFSE